MEQLNENSHENYEKLRKIKLNNFTKDISKDVCKLTPVTAPLFFKKIANYLINEYVMTVIDYNFRIIDIEFYLHSSNHPDTFVQKHPDQSQHLKWYFRKASLKYKEGATKGINITFGNEDSVYGGILIRGIECLESGNIYEGPCNVVNKILKCAEQTSITDLTAEMHDGVFENNHILLEDLDGLKYEGCDEEEEELYAARLLSKGPRILKTSGTEEYLSKPYRYAVKDLITKRRKSLKKI